MSTAPLKPLSPDAEATWLSQLRQESAYGLVADGNRAWLILQPELFYEQRHRLLKGQLILGRMDTSPEYSVLRLSWHNIANMGVSRYHAALVPLESGVGIHDLGSTNGTYVNGHRLATGLMQTLAHHDTIQLSQMSLYVHLIPRERVIQQAYNNLLGLFAPVIAQGIDALGLSAEGLYVLARRLPNDLHIQQQVLEVCQTFRPPISLEDIHLAINDVLSEEPHYHTDHLVVEHISPDDATIPQRDASMQQALHKAELELTQRVVAAPLGKEASYTYAQLLDSLDDYSARAEAQLQHYLEQAALLHDPDERQQAFNRISALLLQLRQWRSDL